MKQIVIPLCSLLLAFTLAGCAGGAKHESPAASSTVSAQNSRTVSTGSAKSSEPVPVSPVESKESLPQESSESGEAEEVFAENDADARQIQVGAVGVPPASSETLRAESILSQQSPPFFMESPSLQESTDETSSEEDTVMKMNVQIGEQHVHGDTRRKCGS